MRTKVFKRMSTYLIANQSRRKWVGIFKSSSTHPDFEGIEKRMKTEIDNLILFSLPEFSCFRSLYKLKLC